MCGVPCFDGAATTNKSIGPKDGSAHSIDRTRSARSILRDLSQRQMKKANMSLENLDLTAAGAHPELWKKSFANFVRV